jgi:hypothetical protein
MTTPEYRAVYTADGVRAVVATEAGAALVELTIAAPSRRFGDRVDLDVLLQPRAANGLPDGPVQPLFSTPIRLRPTPDRRARHGACWLPAYLKPGLLRVCYLRVRPTTKRETA